jgi:hypothetical protein
MIAELEIENTYREAYWNICLSQSLNLHHQGYISQSMSYDYLSTVTSSQNITLFILLNMSRCVKLVS